MTLAGNESYSTDTHPDLTNKQQDTENGNDSISYIPIINTITLHVMHIVYLHITCN